VITTKVITVYTADCQC